MTTTDCHRCSSVVLTCRSVLFTLAQVIMTVVTSGIGVTRACCALCLMTYVHAHMSYWCRDEMAEQRKEKWRQLDELQERCVLYVPTVESTVQCHIR
jgi:hypothetical protein